MKDEYQIDVPEGVHVEQCQIAVGMYTWPDLKRLPEYDSTGRPVGDRVLIAEH